MSSYISFNSIYHNLFKVSYVIKVGAINESISMNIYSRTIALVMWPQCEGALWQLWTTVAMVTHAVSLDGVPISHRATWHCLHCFQMAFYIIVTDCLVFFLNVTVMKGLISSTNILHISTSALQRSMIRKRRRVAFYSVFCNTDLKAA